MGDYLSTGTNAFKYVECIKFSESRHGS